MSNQRKESLAKKLPDAQPSISSKNRPFIMRRAVHTSPLPGTPGDEETGSNTKPKLCKKCESLTFGANSESIHSTLAYSRCRCHRHFKYKAKKLEEVASGEAEKLTSQLEDAIGADQRRRPIKRGNSTNAMSFAMSSSTGRNNIRDNAISNKGSRSNTVPGLSSVPSVPSLPFLPEGETLLTTKQEPASPRKTHHSSPTRVLQGNPSDTKLPSIVSHIQQPKSCSVSEALSNQFVTKKSSTTLITELVDIVRVIDASKRKYLRERFREIDKNGDGHITCTEFLDNCPACTPSSTLLLKQFYAALNEATYFGFREFMLCYSIAERLNKSDKLDSFMDITVEILEAILCPFIKYLASLAGSGGTITQQNIKASVVHFNQETDSGTVISTHHLTQVITAESKMNILDCLALAPYYLIIS